MGHIFYPAAVDFGRSKLNATGSSGVGYTIYDKNGSVLVPRSTAGVVQVSPGIYSVSELNFSNVESMHSFFQIVWDTGSAFSKTFYATETILPTKTDEEVTTLVDTVNNLTSSLSSSLGTLVNDVNQIFNTVNSIFPDLSKLIQDVETIKDFTSGRWRMHDNQMVFYKEDNVTEIARFDLFDDTGSPSMEAVFERRKV